MDFNNICFNQSYSELFRALQSYSEQNIRNLTSSQSHNWCSETTLRRSDTFVTKHLSLRASQTALGALGLWPLWDSLTHSDTLSESLRAKVFFLMQFVLHPNIPSKQIKKINFYLVIFMKHCNFSLKNPFFVNRSLFFLKNIISFLNHFFHMWLYNQ